MSKYRAVAPVHLTRCWPDRQIAQAPLWCSVDLRDGNQALPNPMGLEEKRELFLRLCAIGFQEIEVGFPAASQTEFAFIRMLIEEQLIPEHVTIQVLTQARRELIERTAQAVAGAPRVIFHLYNSTSEQQRRITFGRDVPAIKAIATSGCQHLIDCLPLMEGSEVVLEYSPESFTCTELPVALEVCEAVLDVWQPQQRGRAIINLPATVEHGPPNHYADQIEYFCQQFRYREHCLISVHTHNDRGCGVAAAELGLLAGADRVEGTLFGNGERTGNTDLVTLALNMLSSGVDPGLDFGALPELVKLCERLTELPVGPRHPYAGELVFTAFSGSHQDAIHKGMNARRTLIDKMETLLSFTELQNDYAQARQQDIKSMLHNILSEFWGDERSQQAAAIFEQAKLLEKAVRRRFLEAEIPWDVPYLPVDPRDLGRNYDCIVRVNSQSGKGGVAYLLRADFGLDIPKAMHPLLGKIVGQRTDEMRRELSSEEIYHIFEEQFVNLTVPYGLASYQTVRQEHNQQTLSKVTLTDAQQRRQQVEASGNGPIDALVRGLEELQLVETLRLEHYHEQALSMGAASNAMAYIQLSAGGASFWGVGVDSDTTAASFKAIIGAFNRLVEQQHPSPLSSAQQLRVGQHLRQVTSL